MRGGELASQIRVLRQVLEVAPAQRRPLHVDARAEHDGDARLARLGGERLTDQSEQLRVPRRADRRRGREAGRRHTAGEPDMVGLVQLCAQAVRTVGHHDLRHAQPLDRAVCQKSEPRHSDAFSSRVSSAEQRLDVERLGCRASTWTSGAWVIGDSFVGVRGCRAIFVGLADSARPGRGNGPSIAHRGQHHVVCLAPPCPSRRGARARGCGSTCRHRRRRSVIVRALLPQRRDARWEGDPTGVRPQTSPRRCRRPRRAGRRIAGVGPGWPARSVA